MTLASVNSPIAQHTTGLLNYLSDSVKHSLFRNGAVLTRRDGDGSDAGTEGVDIGERSVSIANARLADESAKRTIEAHGFELLNRPLARQGLDFYEHQQVVVNYYPECAELVRRITGAAQVFAFDHNIRSASGKNQKQRIAGGQQVQGPARIVHGDYTLTSGPARLHDLTNPPSHNDTLRSVLAESQALLQRDAVERVLDGGRFAIINVWRNISEQPVATNPLALCDGQTVQPEDLVVFEIHYADRIGENYFAKHAARHRWYYYPEMTRDEALLIKQWDSAGGLARSNGARADVSAGNDVSPCTFSFHTAFEDPLTSPDAPDRRSIEVRCVVLYD